MKRAALILGALLASLLAAAPPAAAGAPTAAPAPTLKSLRFEGTLREAIDKVATEGHLSVVATGDLDQRAHLVLHDVSAEQALQTLAHVYHLNLQHDGPVWTVSPGPSEPAGPTPPPRASAPSVPAPPPVPAVPPVPGAPGVPGLHVPHGRHHPTDASAEDAVGTGSVTVAEDQTVDDAVAYGGTLEVLGHVQGDAVSFGGDVHLGPHAVVDGDVSSFGGSIRKDAGAQVGGEEQQLGGGGVLHMLSRRHGPAGVTLPPVVEPHREHHGAGSFLPGFLIQFAVYFGLGFLFIMFAPNRMRQIEGELERDPVKCVLAGLLGALAFAFLTLLLTITIIGIPFALVLVLLVALAVAMGFSAVALEIGTRLPLWRGRKTQAAVLALGVAALLLVGLIPVVGPAVLILVGLFSLGAILRTRLGTGPRGLPEPLST